MLSCVFIANMATPTTHTATPITIALGDGIGPEIMAATLAILKAGFTVAQGQ